MSCLSKIKKLYQGKIRKRILILTWPSVCKNEMNTPGRGALAGEFGQCVAITH
jgi:hypothetical protein